MGRSSGSTARRSVGWRRLRRAALSGAVTGALFALLAEHVDAPSAAPVMAATVVSGAAPAVASAVTPVAAAAPSPSAAPSRAAPPPAATPLPSQGPTAAPTPQPASLNVQRSTPPPPTPRPAPRPTQAPPTPPTASGPTGAALAILQLVNQDRAAAGLAPLRFDAALTKAAAQHAAQNAAANQMSHNGIYADLGAAGVAWTTLGECLGWDSGAPDPAYVNSMWMQSSEHRPIIVGSFTKAGAGWARSSSGASYVSLILTT